MTVNGKTLTATAIITLIAGSLLGTWYSTHRLSPRQTPQANGATASGPAIRIEIDGAKKPVLAPQIGDTVEWYQQATPDNPNPASVDVTFDGWSPCSNGKPGQNISYCNVAAIGNYEYRGCVTDPATKKQTCFDPGMDPRSTTNLANGTAGVGTSTPVTTNATEPRSLPRNTIYCDQTQTTTYVITDPILVDQGEKIIWIAGPKQNFTITTSLANFCSEQAQGSTQIQANRVAVCTVAAPSKTTATYIVNGVCNNNNSGTFHITVN